MPSTSLNEGGGFHPRNPLWLMGIEKVAQARSVKAGALTPAIPMNRSPFANAIAAQ